MGGPSMPYGYATYDAALRGFHAPVFTGKESPPFLSSQFTGERESTPDCPARPPSQHQLVASEVGEPDRARGLGGGRHARDSPTPGGPARAAIWSRSGLRALLANGAAGTGELFG